MNQDRLARRLALIGLVLLLAALYVYGAVRQLERVNTEMTAFDQSAYMDFTRQIRESGFTYTGDRNRMPVYPTLQALFYRSGTSDETFFRQGKYVNLVLSLILLAGLALIFRRYFSPLHTLNLTLITGFTVFIFRAGWFQSELLFYFFNFCLFLLFWRLLERPSLLMAVLAGVMAALAHLTKASILPGLVVFAVCAAAQAVWAVLRRRRTATAPPNPQSTSSCRCCYGIRNPQAPWLYLAIVPIVLGLYLLILSPYLNESKRIFGQYFYNVNSTFYIWYDSWPEAKEGTRAHGDRVGWPDMPADQIPSMAKYLREHSLEQIRDRFVEGGQRVLENAGLSYGYAKYALIYAAALIAAVTWERRRAVGLIRRHPLLVAFLLLYFAAYFVLYAWYSSIVAGNRLILSQFVPLLFTLSMGLRALLRDVKVQGERPLDALTALNLLVLGILVVDVALVLTVRVGIMEGGS
jgi:hypothetical protein